MAFVALTDREEIDGAFRLYAERMHAGAEAYTRNVGFQSGGGKYTVRWLPQVRLWMLLDPNNDEGHYWCCYGVQDPTQAPALDIACEINFAKAGANARLAGALVRDDDGRTYLAHSGGIGGGRRGVGKQAFLDFYQYADLQSVLWPNGRTTSRIIIAALDAPELAVRVAQYVSAIAAFKASVARQG